MAWERIRQIHAESNDPTEFQIDPDSTGTITAAFSAVEFNTGSQSLSFSQNERGIGYAFAPSARAFRSQVFLRHNGLQAVANVTPFNLITSSGARHTVVWDAAADLLRLLVNSVEVATTAATGSGITPTNVFLQIGCTFWSDPTAGYFSFYIGSNRILTHSGNTGGVGDGVVGCFTSGKTGLLGWNPTAYVDDMYMDRSTTIEADVVPGTRTFGTKKVNAAGASTQFAVSGAASNFQAVDDVTPNDDTDYIFADAAALIDKFGYTNVTVPASLSIKAMIVEGSMKKTDAGTASQLRAIVHDGVNPDSTGDDTDLEVNYTRTFLHRFENAPDGAQWTEVKANSAQFGIESRGAF